MIFYCNKNPGFYWIIGFNILVHNPVGREKRQFVPLQWKLLLTPFLFWVSQTWLPNGLFVRVHVIRTVETQNGYVNQISTTPTSTNKNVNESYQYISIQYQGTTSTAQRETDSNKNHKHIIGWHQQ